MNPTLPRELELQVPTDEPVIRFRRFVAAPPELVFELLTTPAHMRRWLGPRSLEMTSCEVDLRVGGTWSYTYRAPDGSEFAFHGEYLEVEPPHRAVQTFVFEGYPDAVATETMALQPVEGGTLLVGESRHTSFAHRDAHVASGMESGMTESYTRLDELIDAAPWS